jgi:hypothetical protein
MQDKQMRPVIFEEADSKDSADADVFVIQSLAPLDKTALGVSIGSLFGIGIFVATNLLLLKGGEKPGPNLILLGQYFTGFEITFSGSLIGLFYGFISGFVLGWLVAFLRNGIIWLYVTLVRFKGNISAVNDFIDNP